MVAGQRRLVATQAEKAERFLALHQGSAPLLMPNPWDVGSAKLLEGMGFEALATTSGGFAATLGRLDGAVTRDEAVAHAPRWSRPSSCRSLRTSRTASPTSPPTWPRRSSWASARGWPDARSRTGTARRSTTPAWRSSGWLRRWRPPTAGRCTWCSRRGRRTTSAGRDDLADTIDRLQRYQEAGADVLFARGDRSRRPAQRCSPRWTGP